MVNKQNKPIEIEQEIYEDTYNIWTFLGKGVYKHYIKRTNETHYDSECDMIFSTEKKAREHTKDCHDCQIAIRQENAQ